MNVKMSSSSTSASLASSAPGLSATNATPSAASAGRSSYVSTCCSRGRSPRRVPSPPASRPRRDADRLRVVEHVVDVLRRVVGVDGSADRTHVGESEVEERPLERRAGEDAERVALADAAREQTVGVLLDSLGRLRQPPASRPRTASDRPDAGNPLRRRHATAARSSSHGVNVEARGDTAPAAAAGGRLRDGRAADPRMSGRGLRGLAGVWRCGANCTGPT